MATRQCGSCTLCCEGWINAKVNGVVLGPDAPCKFSTKVGCSIYETRPAVPCASFKCGWLKENSPLPDHMIPIECGAIVLLDRKWLDEPIICALPTGPTIPAKTLEWLMAYARKHSLPLVFIENVFENGKFVTRKQTGYGPPKFVQAVKNMMTSDDILMF